MLTMRYVLAALLLPAGVSNTVTAQEAAAELERLRDQLRSGDVVRVTGRSGGETRTQVRDAAAAEVERLIDRLNSRADDITRIELERSDSLWNGTLLGLAVAGTPWLIVCALNDWCYYNEYGAENFLRTTALTTAAIGAGIGVLWDRAVRKRVVVYDAAGGAGWRIQARPEVSRGGASIRVSAAF